MLVTQPLEKKELGPTNQGGRIRHLIATGRPSCVAQDPFSSTTLQPQEPLRAKESLSLLPAQPPELPHRCDATAHGGRESFLNGVTPSSSRSSRPSPPEDKDCCPEGLGMAWAPSSSHGASSKKAAGIFI